MLVRVPTSAGCGRASIKFVGKRQGSGYQSVGLRTSKGPIRGVAFVIHKRRSENECQPVKAGQSSNLSQSSKMQGQRTSASVEMLVRVPTSAAADEEMMAAD